jgi:hypothetical protein
MSTADAKVIDNVGEELVKISRSINGEHKLLALRHFGVPGQPMSNRSLERYMSGQLPQNDTIGSELLDFFEKCLLAQQKADAVFAEELARLLEEKR